MNMRSLRPLVLNAGFTLTELLVVIAVVALLMALAVPPLLGTAGATRLTSSGDLLLNSLSEAQMQAVASDSEVEVRFYEKSGSDDADPTPRLRAFQVFTAGAKSGPEFLPGSSIIRFSDGIVISSKEKLTSLVQDGFREGDEGVKHVAVRFLPDGSTNLNPGSQWFLTLVETASESKEGVPANFYTLQIDAATGRLRTFRP